eukprot:c25973_g1_i1 orf=445-1950(+)
MGNDSNVFDSLLCEELLAEVIRRVEDGVDQKSVSLVCKRWLMIQRRAKKRLGLCVPSDSSLSDFLSSIHDLLCQHSQIVSLVLIAREVHINAEMLDVVLDAISSSCKFLRVLQFSVGPITGVGLRRLAIGCPGLVSLDLTFMQVRNLHILLEFKSLRELYLRGSVDGDRDDLEDEPFQLLRIEKLALEGVTGASYGLGWLWRSCPGLVKLELFNCEGIVDTDSSSFVQCLPSLKELHLRRCRSIAGRILILVAEYCAGLTVLTFHDGGATEGLHHVIRRCQKLEVLDLRLPLDLRNEDLVAIAQNCFSLKSLRLHSCWLPTGSGMRWLAAHIKSDVEELVLVRCRAVAHDSGTLYAIGQRLKCLKSLDLSDNDHLSDNELVAMLASCQNLLQLKLCRCHRLTDKAMYFISQRSSMLESIEVTNCYEITSLGICSLLSGCPSLRKVGVEKSKITNATKRLAITKGVTFSENCPLAGEGINSMFHEPRIIRYAHSRRASLNSN